MPMISGNALAIAITLFAVGILMITVYFSARREPEGRALRRPRRYWILFGLGTELWLIGLLIGLLVTPETSAVALWFAGRPLWRNIALDGGFALMALGIVLTVTAVTISRSAPHS